jgi:hypothetical protein
MPRKMRSRKVSKRRTMKRSKNMKRTQKRRYTNKRYTRKVKRKISRKTRMKGGRPDKPVVEWAMTEAKSKVHARKAYKIRAGSGPEAGKWLYVVNFRSNIADATVAWGYTFDSADAVPSKEVTDKAVAYLNTELTWTAGGNFAMVNIEDLEVPHE